MSKRPTGRVWGEFREMRLAPLPVPEGVLSKAANQSKWRMFQNNLYAVLTAVEIADGMTTETYPDGVPILHLSIRRLDRKTIRNWRDLQRIKSEIAGSDCEAVELYPGEERHMDAANSYHLYCLPAGMRFPFGERGRAVADEEDFRKTMLEAGASEDEIAKFHGKQEPFEFDKNVTVGHAGALHGWEQIA